MNKTTCQLIGVSRHCKSWHLYLVVIITPRMQQHMVAVVTIVIICCGWDNLPWNINILSRHKYFPCVARTDSRVYVTGWAGWCVAVRTITELGSSWGAQSKGRTQLYSSTLPCHSYIRTQGPGYQASTQQCLYFGTISLTCDDDIHWFPSYWLGSVTDLGIWVLSSSECPVSWPAVSGVETTIMGHHRL